jgi:hypothetical protein
MIIHQSPDGLQGLDTKFIVICYHRSQLCHRMLVCFHLNAIIVSIADIKEPSIFFLNSNTTMAHRMPGQWDQQQGCFKTNIHLPRFQPIPLFI